MIASQLYHLLIRNFPDFAEDIVSYSQPNKDLNKLKLTFTNGKKGLFTYVAHDHYILEVYPK